MNGDLIKQLKYIKKNLVNKELIGEDWEERQVVIGKLEDAVAYLNDCTEKGIDYDN